MSLAAKRLRADLFAWQEAAGIPSDRELGDLTLAMLGSDQKCGFGGGPQHPGGTMAPKATETVTLMGFALHLLRKYENVLPGQESLIAAGEALDVVFSESKSEGMCVSRRGEQRIFDASKRHILLAQANGIHLVPKHHFFMEATRRMGFHGNFRAYSCFLDESLNLVLRNVAAFAHRAKLSYRVLHMLNLIGELKLSEYLFGSGR